MRACTVGDNTIDRYTGAHSGAFVGGNALNVAVNLSRLGVETAYFGAIGNDADGQLVLTALATAGVDTDGVRTLDAPTATTLVHVDASGERTFLREDYGASGIYQPDAADVERIAGYDIVHIGMLATSETLRKALCGRVRLLSQDCAVTPSVEYLDVAFISAGPDLLKAEEMARDAVHGGAKLAVATCGEAGSVAFDGRRTYRATARRVTVVDSTGAGDSFIAAFLAIYGSGGSVPEALASATEAAARTCGHIGAWVL